MPSENTKNDRGLISSLRLTNLFHLGKKTKDINEEIYHDANFTNTEKLIDPVDESAPPEKKQ